MSSYTESEDVAANLAADFRDAMEDITTNSKYEIQNLTLIARENTEHALAISGAIMEHIKRTAPQKKLPGIYVIDSIVKNVGTPYTLFFGRKLFQIFMDTYARVDNPTRRKMDEMLKTWKQPIAGSMDPRPVFPPDVVRPIENALITARTNALQAQQEQARNQQQLRGRGRPGLPPQGTPHRDVHTPPNGRPHQANGSPYPVPPSNPIMNGQPYGAPTQPPATAHQPYHNQPQRSTPQPPLATTAFQPPPPHGGAYGWGAPQAGISIEALNGDIQRLIAASQIQIAQSPHDPSVQTRLKALMDLQTILQTQNLPPDQLVLVKNQIADLAVTIRAPPPPQASTTPIPQPYPVAVAPPPPAAPTPTLTPTPVPAVALAPATVPTPAAAAAQPAAPKISLDSLFGSGSLAALMARNSATPQVSTPTPPQPPPPAIATAPASLAAAVTAAIRSPTPGRAEPHKPSTPLPADPMALLNALRKTGILPPTQTPSNAAPPPVSAPTPASAPAPAPAAVPAAMPSLPFPFPFPLPLPGHPSGAGGVAPPPTMETLTSDITFDTSSLKRYRPYLLPFLFESLGPQCSQCGRRFTADDEGRKKKTAHMDWHFKVNRRITEAEKGAQHRSWLVDKTDWINSRETIDEDQPPREGGENDEDGPGVGSEGAGGPTSSFYSAAGGKKNAPRLQYIPVPDDPVLANSVCPICQERFETRWLDDAQEFVWPDAIRVAGRVYHASCHREATNDEGFDGVGLGIGGAGAGGVHRYTVVNSRSTPEPVLGKRKAEDELTTLRGKPKIEAT